MAQPYRRGKNGQPVPVSRVFFDVVPAGDFYMTAGDMARFLGAQLNGGVFNGVRILSPESVAETQHNQVPPLTDAMQQAVGAGYGLGLGTYTTPEGHTMIQHGGSVPGLNAHMLANVTGGGVAGCRRRARGRAARPGPPGSRDRRGRARAIAARRAARRDLRCAPLRPSRWCGRSDSRIRQ
jgi:CubicO group peptidase (beta-lactamase class C family)